MPAGTDVLSPLADAAADADADAEVGRNDVAGGSDTSQPRAITSARTSISLGEAAAAAKSHSPTYGRGEKM